MSDDAPGVSPVTPTERAMRAAERVATLGRKAAMALHWERIWPLFALALTLCVLFLAASWFGLWLAVPIWARIAGVAVTGLALAAIVGAAVLKPRPTWRESLGRLDRDSALAHRPATALSDELAINTQDAGTRALWEAHRARVLEQAARLKVASPEPRLAERDPWALRFAVALTAIAAFFVAGAEWEARLKAAFDWTAPPAPVAAFRIDGWIDPPAYTQVPPVLLDLRRTAGGPDPSTSVKVPAKSTLVIRASDAAGVTIDVTGGLTAKEEPKPEQAGKFNDRPQDSAGAKTLPVVKAASADGKLPAAATGLEARYDIKGDGVVTVRRGAELLGTVTIAAIADSAPSIQPLGEPQADSRGTLALTYEVKDDYGVVSAEARLGKPVRNGKPIETRRPPLIPAPPVPLVLPGGDNRDGEGRTTTDLSMHPWAGARVEMTLVARDELGQEGESVSFNVTLPQRPFTKPVAKALIEQRRDLILDPAGRGRILTALNAMMIAPDRFTPDPSVYLGLRTAMTRLRTARTDKDLISLSEYLWDMAVQIEEGDMSDAEKALQQAQDALRDALDRNASNDEIARLSQELRRAMDQYLREFAEKMMREQRNNPQQDAQNDRNMRTITPQDLKSMVDRMEQMAREGKTEDAQRMLEQLRRMMENLKTARPGQSQRNQAQRQMDQQMDELDKMTRDQQELRDKTFREGQKKRDQARQGQQRGQQGQQGQQSQRGQQGQKGQRGQQGQQGQPGQGGDQQDEMAQGDGEGDEGMEGLGQNQQQLRERLEQLKRRMKELGMNGEQGLDDAEDAMKQAEGALGQGQDGEAVGQQGRALDGLRRGAQGMAQQMQQQGQGDGTEQADGDPQGPGQPGNRRAQSSEPNDDPLGRPTPTTEAGDRSKFRKGGKGGTLEQRAREVTEELRRRLGDPARPQDELEYLQRLLPAN